MRWSSGDYQIAPLPPQGGKGRCARRARIYLFLSLRHGRTNNFYHSNRQRQRKAVLAQSGERQRSGKRRLREGKCGRQRTGIAREGFLDRRSKRCFWLLLSPKTKVARAGARNYPRRRQILRLRRCGGDTSSVSFADTCLPAGRSVRGSDTPPACHSTPRTPQGEGLAPAGGCSKKVHGFSAKLKGRIKESEYAIKQKER